MTYLLLGGTSGLGRNVANELAARGESLVVVSSDLRDARAQAADLALRFEVRTEGVALDLAQPDPELAALDRALKGLGRLRGIIVAAGASREGDVIGNLEGSAEATLRVNFLGPSRVVEHFLPTLEPSSSSLIVGIGSIAACRGRRRNVVYSAAKSALASYFESLRHASGQTGIRIHFYTVGYLDTNLAFGLNLPLPVADPSVLARRIVGNLDRPSAAFYFPRYWRGACLLLRLLPWPLFRLLRH